MTRAAAGRARVHRAVVEGRGWVDGEQVDAFLAAGYTRRRVLDILGVGVKTLSNSTNHIAHTPLDRAWAAQAWPHSKPSPR